ncbi:MAG TPA: hypothetical protein VNN21_00470 [Dehalococcoidia bacterium]|nr:hypothetical protein [Dehalococcoidia bacterium]
MTSDFAARSRQFRDALSEALADLSPGGADADLLTDLRTLIDRGLEVAKGDATAGEALEALAIVAGQAELEAALASAALRFESPQRFREALYFARCLERDSDAALQFLQARAFLEGAVAPAAAYPDLATDQAALIDAATFEALWRDASRLPWLLDTIDIWRQAYLPVYLDEHQAFNAAVAEIAERMDGLSRRALALEQLNGLRRLGSPQAEAALAQFHDLKRLFACPADGADLQIRLRQLPICPHCGFRLGDRAPTLEAARVELAIDSGLETQRARLARRVVSRILSSPGGGTDRLERFIQVVQASDFAGLAAVLDEGLIAFLRDLLDAPEARFDVLARLAREYPEVESVNLESVVSRFRALLEEELGRAGGRFRLAADGDT